MTVANTGVAAANNVAPGSLTPAGTGNATLVSSPSPPIINIPGGNSHPFVWRYQNTTAGTFSVSGGASGTDANSGSSVTAPSVTSNTALQ
jgi:hypothetical protein